MSKKTDDNYKVVAFNKRARFDYELIEIVEAGLMLMGSEVKSLRVGKSSINEAFIGDFVEEGNHMPTLCLINANITEYSQAKNFGHTAKRARRLLMHRRQIAKFQNAIRKKGMTIVPLRLYFNHKGIAKLEIALAKGKQTHDKRQAVQERDWAREKGRALRNGFD